MLLMIFLVGHVPLSHINDVDALNILLTLGEGLLAVDAPDNLKKHDFKRMSPFLVLVVLVYYFNNPVLVAPGHVLVRVGQPELAAHDAALTDARHACYVSLGGAHDTLYAAPLSAFEPRRAPLYSKALDDSATRPGLYSVIR